MPSEQRLMDHFYIKIDGADLPIAAMDDLIEVTVDSNLHLPDMFTIQLHDETLTWLDEPIFALGKAVEISAVPEEGGDSRALIKGEITALEPDFSEGTQATLLVRGYDRSHRLHRGTHSRAYQQVTDSDLVRRIAQQVGLQAVVDETGEVYDHVLQYNQTYMEFLAERARRIGYELFIEDKTIYFRQPSQNDQPLELEWGRQLRRFNPRLSLVEQVDEVVVRAWNPTTRQVITGQATQGKAEPQLAQDQNGATLASTALNSNASRVVVNRAVRNPKEATTLAQAICDELSGAFIEAEGLCYGQPELKAGKLAKLTALGQRFNGIYFVTAATHSYRARAGYTTTFSVHGRRSETLYTLLERATGPGVQRVAVGPVVALVTNNRDPQGWGRVKVKYPWLSDEVESDWVRPVSPGAGPERGFYCLPEVNDEVLVVFEHNDINRPYVLGGLWNGQDKPPLPKDEILEGGKVRQRVFKTRAGHMLTFMDGTEAGIILQTSGGHLLRLNDSANEVTLESKGNLSLKAMGEMSLEAARVNVNNGALEVT